MMAGRAANENRRLAVAVGKPVPGVREMGDRRALREINNLVGAAPYPCAIAKKPMLQKSRRDEQKPAVPSSRPITRRFAASLASKEHHEQQKTAPNDAAPGANHQKEIIEIDDSIIDVDLEPDSSDHIDMEEIQRKENVNDDAMDIDSADSGNPLAVTEYVEELYKFYRETEKMSCVRSDYMSSQGDINEKMRAILIDSLIEVHYKFELMDETLFLTANIIDRSLEKQVVPRKKLQLVGVTAMLLAYKYEEMSVPVVEDLILIEWKKIHKLKKRSYPPL